MNRCLLLLLLLLSLHAYAQEKSNANRAVQLDIGGPGGYGAVHYEHTFTLNSFFALRPRVGFSFLRLKDYRNTFNPDLCFPLGINVTYGNKHMAEIGFGNTYTSVVQANTNSSPTRSSSFHGSAHIGYRYQKPTGGLLFRIGYVPLWEQYNSLRHWGVLTVGWAF